MNRYEWRKLKAENKLGDKPIEEKYWEDMNKLAKAIDIMFNGNFKGSNRKTGFVLLLFPFGEDSKGRCNFISNGADRKDVVTLFKEMIARFEGQPEQTNTDYQ